jgi:hypothetical protein
MGKDFGAELFGAPDKGRDFGADLFGAPAKPEDVGILSGTGEAFKRGLDFSDIGRGYGIAGLKLFGSDEEVAKKMAEAKAEQAKTVEKPAISFADLERIYKEKGLGAALSNVPKYIAESTAESAPQMAVPLAVGAAAGAVSGPFAPIVAPVAGIATYGLQQFGNLMTRQGQEAKTPEDINVGKAAIASAIQAPIGYFVDRFTLGLGGMGEKGVIEIGKELAKRKAAGEIGTLGVASGVAKQAGKGAAQGFIAEAPTEVLEQSLERWQAGLPLADADAYREYKEAFFGAGGVGLTGGAISRGATAYKGTKTPQEITQEEAPLTTTSAPQGQLLLPRPDEILLNEKEYDPLKNPVGNFTWQELTKEQRAYINKDRKENGKPLLNTYSLEDVVDAIRHTENTPEAQEGAINTLLAYKTNYDQINNEQLNADLLFKKAELHNVDTGTQGWNDYLMRVTGTDDIASMTQPQLYSAFKALDQLEVNPAERIILPEGTNAVRFNEKQYADALKGIESDFGEYGTDSLSRTSVIDTIKEYTNLTRTKDAEALYNQAIKRGDLEENLVERNTTEGKKFVPEVSFAGKSEALPGGFDIRDQAFKQGAEPEAYEIRNGAAFLKRVNDPNTAQQEVEKLTKINEGLVKESQKKIDKLTKTIEYRNAQLDLKRATGFANTLGFKKLEAHIDDLNKTDQKSIAVHENDIKNLTNPLQIVPVGEKPVVKRKQVFYKEGKPTASFEKKEEAEAYGILNLDDATLEQIVASAPTTKGTLPKRYAAMAKKELERRRTDQKGIEVKRSFYTDETKEKADELAKTLIPALKRFGLENVGLRIVNSIRNGTADGEWAQQVITIAMDSKNPMGTLRHESIHALKELGAFTDAEWKVLENKAKGEWVQRFIKDVGLYDKYKEEYKKVNNDSLEGFDAYINEEAIAEAFKYFENFQPPAGMVGNIFYRISQMMEAIRNAFNGVGLNTSISIFNKIETGEMQIDASLLKDNVRLSLRQNEPRKIGDRIVGAPPNAPTEADRKKLVSRMVKLLEHPYSMYERSKDWYERSGATIKDIARDDPVLMEQIVRLTALYSQANSLGGNITAVIKSIAQIANGNQKVLAGRFPETTAKVIPDILAAKTMDTSLKGVDDKLMNFYRNLHDATFETDTFQDSSTIDRWMMRLFGYPHTEDQELGGASAVSATQYKYAKDLIERITEAQAKKTGEQLHPRQIQSALWTYIRNMSNYDDAVDKAKAKAIEENKKFNKNAVEFTPDILDFSDYVKRATAHITWETRPSESLPMIQGIHTAPREQQDAFNRAVQAIFTDPSGEDKVFKLLNNQQLYTSQFSIGAYENKIAPNIITKVVLQKDESGHLVDVAREYSAIIGYVTRQDAVPWYRPDPTASGKLASKGYKVSLDVPITQELEESLFKHINDSLPGVGFTKVDESFDFINYRGDDGKPYMMSDKKYIDELQNALQTFSSDVHFNIDEFRAQSEYFSNNWKEQTNGEGHLSRISPERLPNIQSTLDNWRNQYDTIAKRFGEEYGWDKETKFSFRSFKPVEPTFRSSEDSGRGITLGNKQENSITVDGVHYGNVKTDELDASKFGTGLRGAERRRLEDTDDERIKKRVYFYIPKPNGEMPTRESGVGSNVYTQTFDNILGQGKEMSRLYSSAMDNMNNFESSIVDAGYDGYAIPEMGMMVILNHNVPVNYEGTIAELSEIGRLEKGRVLPKPVLPENLQNEVKELRGLVSNITLAKIERALADYTEIVVNAKITPEQRKMAEDVLAPYYEKAKAIKPLFEEKLKKVAESVGGVLRIGGIKKVGRAAEKLTLETKNGLLGKPDGKDIMDLLRATIVVPTVDQVPVAIENIGAEFKNVQRIKDRFKNPTPNGYRDVLMNVKLPNQLFAEVQINIPEMIVAKHTGHKIYKMSRSLDEGTAKHEQLVNTERALYDEAYLFAQKAKSESSALEPLLRNASLGKGTEVSRAQTNEPSFSLNTGSASTANNVAPSGTLNGTLNIDNSSTEKNKRFSLALGSVEPSTFLVSDTNPNSTGDLAFIPVNSRVPIKPIRLAVGTHSGLDDKGFGANHIIDRIRKDASRRPPVISKELLEDIILNVENVGKSFSRIYQEINPIYGGTTYILYDPKTRDSLIVRPRADYYEVITAYKQDVGSKYGNPVWSGANVQPEQPVGFFTKQQGISVKSGERGVETQAVATVVKKRRVLSPEALQQMADDRAGKFSLRAPDTVPFKRWFGNSKIVNPDGTPKVMYHGTARDISVFKPKQAEAIFLTDKPDFAQTFSNFSENRMVKEVADEMDGKPNEKRALVTKLVDDAIKDKRLGTNKNSRGLIKTTREEHIETFINKNLRNSIDTIGIGDELFQELKKQLPSNENIMPLFVKAENPFDYENKEQVAALVAKLNEPKYNKFLNKNEKKYGEKNKDYINRGHWNTIEAERVQDAIRKLGHDAFYVKEGGVKNLAVYEPSQIKSATGNQGTYDINNPDIRYSIRGEALPSDIDKGDNLTFLLQDKQIDLKRVIENIRKQGKDIADKWNAYLQEELFHGRSAARVKYYIDRELQPMLRKMDSANITLEQMDDYLLARHAKEANAYIRTINNDPKANSGMSDQQADTFMGSMTVPRRQAFERIAKDVDAMTKQTRQMMVDYGLETQKTIDTWEKTYKNYVPLFREETEGGAISTGRGYNIRGSTTRARIGSSKGVIDVLANIALQRERTIARGEKNRVGNALLGLILQNPDKNFWSAIRPDEMSKSDLESELLAMGLSPDVARNLADKPKERVLNTVTGNYEFKTNPLWLQQPNIFITRVNGEDRVMIFNKDNERSSRMAVVFNNLDANQKAEAIKMMGTAGEYFDKTVSGVGTATRYFAAINTQYNPAFSIFNFLRDVGGATLNLQSTPLKGKEMEVIGNSLTALKSIYRDLRLVREGKQANSKWAQIFEEFELEGGKTGFRDIFNTSEERANALAAELNAFKQGGARTKAKAVFDWLSDFNEAVENSIRVSAYKSAIDMGMSKQQAASLAKNLTVNFNRTGAVSKNFTTLYAFFNASVQGTARIAETLMKDGKLSDAGKKIVYGGIGVGVLQSVLLAMAGFDEDEPPEFVKDKNFVIPYGDKKYISIPMPLGFNIFPAFGRRATEFAMSDNKNAGKAVFDMSTMIMDAFNPLGSATFAQTLTPTLLDPIVALSENKDFSGKPISKDDLNSLNPTPGYTRAKENASAVSTGLAYGINFLTGGTDFKKGAISPTPDQIDYLIGQVTGGVGREILKTEKLLGSTISGEELATNNVPVIGRMLGDVKQKTVETSRFYDNVKTMNEHQHEIEGRIKAGQDLDEYLNAHPEAGLYKYVDKTYNKVNQMKRSRKLLKEQNVPDSDLKSYDEAILVLMTSLNDAIREAKVSR